MKILYDIYHVQIMEGNLIETIRKNIAQIGHFHVGDVPERHEPARERSTTRNVFRAIRETGFKDFVAMEYVPLKDAMTTLREARALAFGAWHATDFIISSQVTSPRADPSPCARESP